MHKTTAPQATIIMIYNYDHNILLPTPLLDLLVGTLETKANRLSNFSDLDPSGPSLGNKG